MQLDGASLSTWVHETNVKTLAMEEAVPRERRRPREGTNTIANIQSGDEVSVAPLSEVEIVFSAEGLRSSDGGYHCRVLAVDDASCLVVQLDGSLSSTWVHETNVKKLAMEVAA